MLAITSANKHTPLRPYRRTQVRYALIYIFITTLALFFLNVYCANTCMQLFYDNKKTSMLGKSQLAAEELEKLEDLTPESATGSLERISTLKTIELIVTTTDGYVIYSSSDTTKPGQVFSVPQSADAANGQPAFTWAYKNGTLYSTSTSVILWGSSIQGYVYASEVDPHQGSLLRSIQMTLLSISILLEMSVIFFSAIFANVFSTRLNKIMASMRILRDGDYSHRLKMKGNDELTILAEEFNDLTERLFISENKRRQFVSDASHELKTPLASIKLLSDSILQNEMDIETIREFVGDIGDEAERLNRMSEKLLSLTRGEPDTANDTPSIIPMAPTVERVVKMLSSLAKTNGITIETDLANDIPILIHEDDFYQITFNLAENGLKYNIPGGKLVITLSHSDECGVLTVSDTGTGIPEDSLSHIFERFYRVDKARSRASGGSGLGLAIVKNMVERNQGTIRVKSTFGMGTTFTVEFPAFDIKEENA